MTASGPAARLHGVRPSAGRLSRPERVGPVDLREGRRYVVGRADRWGSTADLERHLRLGPRTRRSVPVNLVEFAVHRGRVHLRPVAVFADVVVDERDLPADGLWLPGPHHRIVVDPLGRPQVLHLVVEVEEDAIPTEYARPSGTTFVPVLHVSGTRLLPMATALTWPLVTDVRPPVAAGWSTADITGRYAELYGAQPPDARHTLNRLRRALVEARTEDGRPMSTLPEVAPWPWPDDLADTPYTSPAAFDQRKNFVTASYFKAAGQVVPELLQALADRPRRRRR
ncbi:hypothetical protein ACFUIT_10050 [Streptomyces sp. NPDC057239]|uniref:hypothetical protein n=1 Tax=Streptomyces sp. NPDC057239 TaxID=3346061 RepID=UPI0036274275